MTPTADQAALSALRERAHDAFYKQGRTRDVAFRKRQLYQLHRCLDENREALLDAMVADGKNRSESDVADLMLMTTEIAETLKALDGWARPDRLPIPWTFALSGDWAESVPEPLGTVLIIGTWNYPVSTIAAGDTAVVKFSEVSVNASKLLHTLLPKYLDNECFQFVLGAVPEITALLSMQWDLIFYTGNGTVGRIIAKAAAAHLTPCILELGGKSPAIIDRGVDVKTMAQRIAAGKWWNNGQTCIAPDYLLVADEMREDFINALREVINDFYGDSANVDKTTKGKVVVGGQSDSAKNYIAPTVVVDVDGGDVLMKDELFGPILPVITYKTFEEALAFIWARDKPLAAYIYSDDSAKIQQFKERVSAGGIVINDSIVHFAMGLPFGGVGPSGYGSYHGKAGFESFSHKKRRVWSGFEFINRKIRYPPYTAEKTKLLRTAMVPTPADPSSGSWCSIM